MVLRVTSLQTKLAVEIRSGNNTSIKSTIRYICRSKICIAYAVYRTISAKGARTKGILDSARPTTQAQYDALMRKVWEVIKRPGNYKASPLARIYIPKPKGGIRPLSVPTYLDRAMQHLFNIILDVFQENSADPRSFGFRRFRSPGWGVKAILLGFWSRKTWGFPKYCVQLDIEKCYDRISHTFILDNVARVNDIQVIPPIIMKAWLEQGFIDVHGELSPPDEVQPTNIVYST